MRAKKRFLSLLLCGALIVSLFPQVALAEEIDGMRDSGVTIGASSLCEHHEAHDESCGYTEGTPGTPCAHEHSETCYVPVTECVHVHDEMCYPPEETADDTATPSDAEDRQPTACTHVCDEESGCVKEELNCPHDQGEHDDACGYAPATEGTPCGYVCEICNPAVKIITAWAWNDDYELIVDGSIGLIWDSVAWDDLAPMLPSITAVIGEAEEILTLDWNCADVDDGMLAAGTHILTAVLPEGYALGEDVPALTLTLEMGGGAVFADGTGDFTVTGEASNYIYDSSTHTLTITGSGALTISGTTTTDKIVIQDGVTANVTLKNLYIRVADCPFEVAGSATCNLTLLGTNTLEATRNERAGLKVEVTDEKTPTLNITAQSTGKLTVTGADYGSGIGGGGYGVAGHITISGGTVVASGGWAGAGIGGRGSNVTIEGGYIVASTVGASNGSFSTGNNGNAVIVAQSLTPSTDTSAWKGIFFLGDEPGKIYGGSVTLTQSREIPAGKLLEIESGETLTIGAGATLTNNGVIEISGTITGNLVNNGTIYKADGATLPNDVEGTIIGGALDNEAFTVVGGNKGTDYTYEDGVLTISTDTQLRIIAPTKTTTNRIVVSGTTANIILDNVNIDLSGTADACALEVSANSTCNLTLVGASTLKSGKNKAGIHVGTGAALTITSATKGALNATSAEQGAGIGGNNGEVGGSITIQGNAVVNAGTKGVSDGIGNGYNYSGNENATILIKDHAEVNAYGYWGTALRGNITVSGDAVVNATRVVNMGQSNPKPAIIGTLSSDNNSNAQITSFSFCTELRGEYGYVDITGFTSGIIFHSGTNGYATYEFRETENGDITFGGVTSCLVYGDQTLGGNMKINNGGTLTIQQNSSLTIPSGKTLTNNGKIINNGEIKGSGTIDGTGEITGSGTIADTITNNLPTVPTITTNPDNASVTCGQTATFTVAASGKPAPAYQWQVSKDNGSTWANATDGTGGTTASYTTPTAEMSMNGWQYRCVVENIKGTATSGAATLTVSKIAQVISYGTTSLTKTYGDANFTNELTQTTVSGAVSYASSNTSVATVNSSTGEVTIVGVGSTTITATAAETATHAQATASYSLTVNKAAQGAFSINGQPTGDIAYGQEFTLATSGGTGSGTVIWAVTAGDTFATVDSASGLVRITGVGSVTITATKAGGANYNDATATYAFTTVQATPIYAAPTGLAATYGQTLANVTLTNPTGNTEGTWSWVEADTTAVGSAGTQTHKAKFTPTDSTNYKTVTDIDVTITVAQADPTYTAPTGVTATYGQTLGDIALTNPAGNTPGTWSWQNSSDLVGNAGTQTHRAKFTPTDSTNYKTVSGIDVTITVGKASGPAAPTVTGSYAANSDFTKFIYTVAEITDAEYKMDGGTWQDSNVFAGIDPLSQHTFYARIKDDGNHEAGAEGNTGSVTFNKLARNENPTLNYTVTGSTGSKVITIKAVDGCEYTFNGGTTWGNNNTQTFAQDTTQTIGIRYGMTDTHNASSGAMQEVSLVNLDQSAPAAFILTFADNGDATFTATIPTVAGGEYSFDGTSWSSTNTKTDCLPNTEYTGYVRLAAKDGYNASPVTSDTQTTPRLIVAVPAISPNGGNFRGSQTVSIATSTPNATIYYTTDGSTPTTGSNEYTAPFTINSSTTVQAIAVRSGYENSGVVTAVFTRQSGGGGSTGGGSTGGGSSSDERSSAGESSTPTITPADPTKPDTSTNASTEITPSVEKDGKADVKIPSGDIDKAITAAQDAAKKNGNEKNGISVTVNITTKTTPEELTITIPAKSIRGLVNAKAKELRLKSELAWLTLDLPTLKQAQAMGGDMKIIITAVDNKTLSTEARAAIGGRPVYRFTVTVGGKPLTKFDGLVSIFIPYQPAATEKPGNLFLVYVDEKGNAEYMTGSSYDVQQKVVMGATTHFSVYGVGYQYDTQLFTDIKGHWAETSIQFVAARGLLSGTGNNQFSPNTGMTRGMFVTALGRLAGIDPGDYKNSKFIDVAADAYYAPYAAWAAEKGIVSGTTAVTFSPDSKITREQMAVIMANYAKAMGYTVPKTREAVTFADASSISTWAKDGVQAMQMAGVLAGKGNNRFDPTGTATRAEVATVLQRYVELVIDTNTAQGWDRNDSGKWMYYVDGKAATGKKTVDGTTYHFDAKGQLTKIEAIAPDTKKYITYKAKKGDTLWGIAQTYGCTVAEIVSLNEKLLTDPNAVLEGWSLKLPQK